MSANFVVFAPTHKSQIAALLDYIDKHKAEITARQNDKVYQQEVNAVRDIMQKHFEKHLAQKIVKVCPWTALGTKDMCNAIAHKYLVPIWHVLRDAAPR